MIVHKRTAVFRLGRTSARLSMAALSLLPALLCAQTGGENQSPAVQEKPVDGIPVTDPLVISKCSGCHKQDAKGNLTRISWERTTPEGWEEVIKRMVRLNGLALRPEEARAIIKSLSTSHGLAPEEARAVSYMPEHRIIEERIPNDSLKNTCASCHPFGRVASFRRSGEEWKLLADLHIGLYPIAELAVFRRFRGPGAPAADAPPGPPPPQPIDQAIDYLTKNYPLQTPEWASWRARVRAPKLAGKWLVSAHVLGRGDFSGEMTIDAGSSDDEFTTRMKLTPIAGGAAIERSGRIVVFDGYAWRGRSTGATASSGPGAIPAEMRESMMIAPDQSQAEGRWFWGAYDEFGADVKLRRASGAASVVAVDRPSLKIGSTAQRVRILGDNLPASLTPPAVDFGSGVTVRRLVSNSAQEAVVEVDVAANAISGKRDVAIGSAVLPNAIAVYDRIDYIKVLPETPIARLGGGSQHPKGYQQFEARAYNRGIDNKPNTADDVDLGPIDASWSMAEFYEVFGDDDTRYVGILNPTGLFTPALDGPNPERKQMRDNYGTVWVVATAKNERDKNGTPLTAKGYLVVSPPLFIVWDKEITP
jgi:quinohemoprotein amine dehydrogenase